MKAAQISGYGDSVVKTGENVTKPTAQAGEVLVEVYAASVNPFDVKLTEGFYKNITLHLPATPGGDLAGKVAEIGEGVEGFEIGQEVYGMANAAGGHGSWAEFTPVKASQLASKPTSVDFNAAGALPLTAVSAYQALVDHMSLQPGQKILIHGGAGGIGSLAIQIAKNIGGYIATTAAVEEADFVKSLGADEVIDYKSQDFSQLLQDYDAVFDTVGGETNQKSYQVLKDGGVLVSMLEAPNEELVKAKNIQYTQQGSQATQERLTKVAELVDAGKLKVNIDKVFSLDQAGEAVEHWRSGHPKGKVVIQVKN
jgi:NADPH:quinone reductase-like Zn-dependent oxidoreductase